MKFSTFTLACAGILGVAAQSAAPSAPSTCAAQAVLDQCLKDAQAQLAQCGAVDYGCECQWQQAISTCYDQCPNDPQASIAAQQVIVYCTAANQTASTSAASGVSTMATMSSIPNMASSAVPMSSAMAPSASASASTSGSASGSVSASRSTSDINTQKVSLLAIVVTTLVALL